MRSSWKHILVGAALALVSGCGGNHSPAADRQESGSPAKDDFTRTELLQFYRDHKGARGSALSACLPKDGIKTTADLRAGLEACLSQDVVGTVLGIRTGPRPGMSAADTTWYIAGNDGSLYECKSIGYLEIGPDGKVRWSGGAFRKYSQVRLSRKSEDARLTDVSSGLGAKVRVTELLEGEFPAEGGSR